MPTYIPERTSRQLDVWFWGMAAGVFCAAASFFLFGLAVDRGWRYAIAGVGADVAALVLTAASCRHTYFDQEGNPID